MFPMKFFEYLAAGLPVVSTPLDAIHDFRAICSMAPDSRSFVDAIRQQLSDRPPPLRLDDPILVENSWDARLDKMLAIVNSAGISGRAKRNYE
jgi:hypothetical protein